MKTDYAVTFGNQQAGKVQVIRQGLYYRFICHCILHTDMICRLYVACGGKKSKLGVVVPEGDGFFLDTKVAVRQIGEGDMTFCLLPKHDTPEQFVPIYPNEPFSYIERLKDGFLAIQNDKIGLAFVK